MLQKFRTMTTVWTSKLFYIVIIITAGPGFHQGYHKGIINISEKIFIKWITQMGAELSENSSESDVVDKWSTAVVVFPLGGILGGLLTGFICNKCGPKKGLIWNSLAAMIGDIILTTAKPAHLYELFVFGRFFVGIIAGLNCGLCQIYLMEIAPAEIRGAVGGIYQFMTVVGVVASQLYHEVLGIKNNEWSFIFMVPMILSALQIFSLPFCPESPIYLLIMKDDEQGAENALKWLRATDDVADELNEMIQDDNLVKELRHVSFKRMFTDKPLKMSLFISSLLMAGQQFTGIKVIVYYSTLSFCRVGMNEHDASNFTFSITVLFLLTTFLSLWVLDFVGRRKLLLFGFICLSVLTSGLTIVFAFLEQNPSCTLCTYMSIVCYAMFIVCYSPGIGCIPWFYTAEIFYHTARPIGVSITVPINWLANFIVGKAFWPLTMVIGYYAYLAFVILDLFFFFSIYLYLPETAKLSTQNIIKFYK